jgi:microcystin-dependent protein
LFNLFGTSFGAVDGAHFSLPDFRGRVPAGVDGTGRLTGNTVVNPHLIGGAGGQETEQGYADVNVNVSGRSYGQTGGEAITVHVTGSSDGGNQAQYGGITGSGDTAHGYHYHQIDVWGQAYGVQSCWADGTYSGGGGGWTRPQTNVQPTLIINFIIKT